MLVGTFLAIGYLIAWRTYHAVLPNLFLGTAFLYIFFVAASLIWSRFFTHFVLVPLSWIASSGNGGDGLGEGSEAALPMLAHMLYVIALPLMLAGGFFGLGYVYGSGLAALGAFSAILCRTEFKAKRTNP